MHTFYKILDNIPYLAWLKDKAGRYISVNAPFAKFFKLSITEIIGKYDREIFSEDIALRHEAYDLEIKTNEKHKGNKPHRSQSRSTHLLPGSTKIPEIKGYSSHSRIIRSYNLFFFFMRVNGF